jgi:hypothetical protein
MAKIIATNYDSNTGEDTIINDETTTLSMDILYIVESLYTTEFKFKEGTLEFAQPQTFAL